MGLQTAPTVYDLIALTSYCKPNYLFNILRACSKVKVMTSMLMIDHCGVIYQRSVMSSRM